MFWATLLILKCGIDASQERSRYGHEQLHPTPSVTSASFVRLTASPNTSKHLELLTSYLKRFWTSSLTNTHMTHCYCTNTGQQLKEPYEIILYICWYEGWSLSNGCVNQVKHCYRKIINNRAKFLHPNVLFVFISLIPEWHVMLFIHL